MNTVYLDPTDWDLRLDANGDIALASNPYSMAQDVASAIKLFDKELWYDTRKGIPHFENALGKRPSFSLYQKNLQDAALTVPEVVQAKADFVVNGERVLNGQVTFIDKTGKANGIQL